MLIPDDFKFSPKEIEEIINILITCKGYGHPLTQKLKEIEPAITKTD